MESPVISGKVNTEMLFPPLVRGTVKVEPITCELDEDVVNKKRKSDCKELISCDMTLMELKRRCKRNKKKPKSGNMTKQDLMTSPCIDLISSKQDFVGVQMKEDELDVELLSIWTQKLSNKTKSKRKRVRKHARSSPVSEVSVQAVTEHIPLVSENSLQNALGVHVPVNVKVQISETDSSDCQHVSCSTNGYDSEGHIKMNFNGELSDEVPKRVSGVNLETGESAFVRQQSQNCATSEASFNCLERGECIFLPVSDTVRSGESTKTDFAEMISREPLSSPACKLDSNRPRSIPTHNPAEEITFVNTVGSDIHGSSGSYPSLQPIPCQVDCNTVILLPDIHRDDSFQHNELGCGGTRCFSYFKGERDCNEDTPDKDNFIRNFRNLCTSFQDSYSCFSPCSGTDSVSDGLPVAMENLSYCATDGPADEAVECSPRSSISDNRDGPTTMEVLENCHSVRIAYPPKRLFSTRQAISPTSQEKLLRAVDADELSDNMGHSRSGLRGAKVAQSPDKVIQIPKNDRNGSQGVVPKGILKAPHVPPVILHGGGGAECTYIHTNAQKAVSFSQMQMQDIEALSVKLVNELKSMKGIVEETLCSNGQIPSKYTVDEIKEAVENAAKVEEYSKKRLSMMARDCKRFCKIMKLCEKKTDFASGYTVRKERKKIIFADEAGGMLCHVKVLESQPASGLVPEVNLD